MVKTFLLFFNSNYISCIKGFITSTELWARLLYGTEDYSYIIERIIDELKIKPWSKIISQRNLVHIKHYLKHLFEEKVFRAHETSDLTWTIVRNLELLESLLTTLINIKKGKTQVN
jgi:hypothetical protein